jgi:hypothetical protein
MYIYFDSIFKKSQTRFCFEKIWNLNYETKLNVTVNFQTKWNNIKVDTNSKHL